ncbi:hypothetical protein FB451DRAFT_1436287 [Mycena latifolia]|nr:hypothetical protein FB451DRAFT_1436287 [Mycena latifolia]
MLLPFTRFRLCFLTGLEGQHVLHRSKARFDTEAPAVPGKYRHLLRGPRASQRRPIRRLGGFLARYPSTHHPLLLDDSVPRAFVSGFTHTQIRVPTYLPPLLSPLNRGFSNYRGEASSVSARNPMHAQLASTPRVRSGDPDAILGPLLSRHLLCTFNDDQSLARVFAAQPQSEKSFKSAKNAPEKRMEERPRQRKMCARQNIRTNTNAAHTAHATGAVTRRIRAVLCACRLWCRPRSARSTVRGHTQVGADGKGGGRSFEDSFDASPVLSAHASDTSPESLLFGPTPLHSDFPPRITLVDAFPACDLGISVATDSTVYQTEPRTITPDASWHGQGGAQLTPVEEAHFARAYSAAELLTLHCECVRKMPLSGLDPSMLWGFMCRDEGEWVVLRRRVGELSRTIFGTEDQPPTWPSTKCTNNDATHTPHAACAVTPHGSTGSCACAAGGVEPDSAQTSEARAGMEMWRRAAGSAPQ